MSIIDAANNKQQSEVEPTKGVVLTKRTMTTRMSIFWRLPKFSTLCSRVAVRPKNVFLPVCSTA